MPSTSLSKHSACQRCRSMKLRCPAREDNASSCGRCLRLKVTCVNPRSKDSGTAASRSISDDFNNHRGNSNPGQNLNRLPSVSSEPDTIPWNDSAEWQSGSQGNASTICALPSFQIPLSSAFTTSEDSTAFNDSNQQEFTSADFEFFGFSHYEGVSLSVDEPANASPFTSSLIPGTIGFDRSNIIHTANCSVSGSDTNLTGLRLSLSQKYHRSRLAGTTKNLGSSSGSLDEDMDQSNPTETSWFGDALQDIARFLGIIEAYSQETRTTTNHGGPAYHSTITIINFLDILSAYLQIIGIFDDLCTQLYGILRASSQNSISELQTLPGLQLAGLSIGHGHLQTKILLQAVVHHFEMIERVLGLPVTYRVSGRVNEYNGLFKNNQQYSRLMAIVMEDECGKRNLNSLKQNLRNMAEFIYK
ncbi:hypothetical protein CC78DRAFT_537103 [Lojkania enalia]|uniref:Zn(2)-C6 fungal-type domain-containing protein n=1 Tax=Lojkania enalia TaxID=147567 RepID=A0A9P4MVU8_9PLEO|nr:hypothetical protein CC78DRAFT_537103 [Didymosphaeria enalia]